MSLAGSLISGVVRKPGIRLLEVTPKTFAGKDGTLLGRQEGAGAGKSVINASRLKNASLPSSPGQFRAKSSLDFADVVSLGLGESKSSPG